MVNRGVRWQLTAACTATTSVATILNTSRPRMDLTDELTFGRVPKFTFTTVHATVHARDGISGAPARNPLLLEQYLSAASENSCACNGSHIPDTFQSSGGASTLFRHFPKERLITSRPYGAVSTFHRLFQYARVARGVSGTSFALFGTWYFSCYVDNGN